MFQKQFHSLIISALILGLLSGWVNAATYTWDGGPGGADANWSTKQNWALNEAPVATGSDQFIFGGAARPTNTNEISDFTLTSLTFNNTAEAFTLGGSFQLTFIAGTGIVNDDTQLQTINMALGLNATLTVNANAGNIALGGVISGGNGITKTGANTLTLSRINTYTGATNVNAGTLNIAVGGSSSASSAVTVSNSGSALIVNGTVNGTLAANASTTVSGSGTVVGAATISGNLNPGDNGYGLLNFTNSLTLASTSVTTMQIANTGAIRGTNFDGINVGTSLLYGGNLALNFAATYAAGNYTYDLFDFASQSGSLNSVSLTGAYSGSLTNNLGVWSGVTGSGNQTWTFTQSTGVLNLVVIPEPKTALLGCLGVLLLLRRRRA